MAVNIPPGSPGASGKFLQKNPAGRIARQVASETSEILKTAQEQVVPMGAKEEKKEETQAQGKPEEKAAAEEKRKYEMMQALENELRDIQEIEKRKEEEKRMAQELAKRKEEEQKQEKPPLEPEPKKKRGILGGGISLSLKRKQRQVEFAKTPSN